MSLTSAILIFSFKPFFIFGHPIDWSNVRRFIGLQRKLVDYWGMTVVRLRGPGRITTVSGRVDAIGEPFSIGECTYEYLKQSMNS